MAYANSWRFGKGMRAERLVAGLMKVNSNNGSKA
jgi:hypothetical protein